jgi:hypothetical protein
VQLHQWLYQLDVLHRTAWEHNALELDTISTLRPSHTLGVG